MMRQHQSERGAAAVELALVVLPLLLLLLGIVEFSRAFYTQLRLQDAAREGARAIALQYDDPGLLDIVDVTKQTLLENLDGVVDDVGDLDDISEITYCDPDADPSSEQYARVELRQTLTLALPLPNNENVDWDTVTVSGTAQMPCEG
jgi:hypothetical protein